MTVLLGDTGGLTGAASVQYTQDTPGVGGSAENGDLFGFALAAGVTVFGQPRFAELAIGAPGEDVFTVSDAGAVTLLFGNVGGLQGPGSEGFSQNNIGVGPGAEPGDQFGFALAMVTSTAAARMRSPLVRSTWRSGFRARTYLAWLTPA